MQIVRQLPSLACLVLGVAIGCAPAMPPMPATVSTLTAAATTAGYRYEGVADPLTHAVTISPVGFKSQVTGVFVRSANAVWNGGTSTFSFDLLVTNNSGGALSTVRGVVLSTTPGSPTVMAAGTSGTLVGGQPYYNYGTLANAATGIVNWQFSIPSATPFRFGFTVQQGAGVDVSPVKNNPPSVTTVTAANPTIAANATTTVTATTSDPNSDALTYSWSAPSGGSFTGSGASVTYTAPAAPGIYAITCTVDDGKGATATGSTSVTVTAGGGGGTGTAQGNVSFGTVPSAAVKRVTVSPATVTINPGDPVTITATGLDNPGNAVASVWNWSQVGTTAISPWRGTFDQGTTGTVASWRTFDGRTDPGPVTITARSANNQTASMVVMVANKAPVISTITPAATCTVARNVPLNFHVVFHDANGDNNTVSPPTLTPNTNHGGYGQGWSGPDYNGDMTVDVNINSFTAAGTKTLSFSNSDGTNTTSVTWNITIL